jgi:ADP-ribosylglycohydrolase
MTKSHKENKGLGCLMGSLIGNASGLPLQYLDKREISPEAVQKARDLSAKANLTSEMGIVKYLVRALAEGKGKLNLRKV